MPEARMSSGAGLGDAIYVVGGVGGTEALLHYDPAADTWTTAASLPRHREHLAAVIFKGELWALGGRQSDSETLASVDIYDPTTDTWREGPAMQEARSGFGAAVVNDKIVAIGGEVLDQQPWQVLATAEVYDPAAGWTFLPDLPTGLHGLPVAATDDKVYALGGSVRAGAIENEGKVLIMVIGD
ncbi:MAG: kelch repeat-containing protein [Caldilineaceae bacterium]